jgi:UDPglucose 6-dehydrogenase
MSGVAVGFHSRSLLDWSVIASNMSSPKWVFDGRNVLDAASMEELGFHVENIGK